MNDFYKAVSALRSVGIGVEVINIGNGNRQIARITGDGMSGSIQKGDDNEAKRFTERSWRE